MSGLGLSSVPFYERQPLAQARASSRLARAGERQQSVRIVSKDRQEDLVGGVAEAITLDRDVQWDRCASRASPADHNRIDNLRVVSGVFASRPNAGQASPTALATDPDPYAGTVVRGAVSALTAIAAIQVVAALVLLSWSWKGFFSEHGELSVFMATRLVGFVAGACLLLFAGGRERRTRALGLYFLLMATLTSHPILVASFAELPPQRLVPDYLLEVPRPVGYLPLAVYLFAPAFLWVFARECPRVYRRSRLDDLARRMVPVSVAIGCSIWIVCAAAVELVRAGYAEIALDQVFDGSLAALFLLSLGAVATVALRARSAPVGEAKRVVAFSLGFAVYLAGVTVHVIAEALTPGSWLSNYRWSAGVVVMEVVRFPGLILAWYGVLAARVPHIREVLRACYRWPLTHPGLLSAAAAVPAVALGLVVASHPERPAGAILADPLVQSLFAAVGILSLALVGRDWILGRLDAWALPEIADQRHALADAAAGLSRAVRMKTVIRAVARAARIGGRSPATLLLAADTGAGKHDLHGPDTRVAPLQGDSSIVHLLENVGGPLRVHPEHPRSIFGLLPPEEAAWVEETEADVILPVPVPGLDRIAALVVGRRSDGRIVRSGDLPFLEALGSMAGMAAARLRLLDTGEAATESAPARECPVCGSVAGASEPPGCDCGKAYVETDVPRLLAGKFRLNRRLSAGGMGAVYQARDLRLDRDVAIKTLGDPSVLRLMQLQAEAWAMATVAHPAVAQIYGIESWRGHPFMVVEFLSGGTLQDRLQQGPVSAGDGVSAIVELADALAALHEKGFLHGDIKPSNIGFTASGSPKLLDFGLARAMGDAAAAGGTLRYVSPEALSGSPTDEADDVWSLCVVLHETVSGQHPFGGGGASEVAERIRSQRVARSSASPAGGAVSEAVVSFAASVLAAPRPLRPGSAQAFAEALRAVGRSA